MFKVTIGGKTLKFSERIKVTDLIDQSDRSIIACKVNNRIRELTFEIYYDAKVELITMSDDDAMRIYEASLRYLFLMAIERLYPNLKVRLTYHISRALFCRILDDKQRFNLEMVKEIEKEMRRIIDLNLPFIRKVVPNSEAEEIYRNNNMDDKIDMLQYRPEKTVHLYQCGDHIDYLYSYLVPSTGYINQFTLRLYSPGIIIQYPRSELNGEIPTFTDEPTYGEALKEASMWAKVCNAETIADINSHIVKGRDQMVDFVNMCEARHNDRLCLLADKIANNIDNIKIIAIAGPSSSGKTTFSHRLRIQLMTRGIQPVKLSIDDYYFDRSTLVPDENGNYDYEHINTIDVDLFNSHLVSLINGEEIQIPAFDFLSGTRKPGPKLKIGPHQPIIIEGIHALNEAMTINIPRSNKFKIYIAPHAQLNIDDHSPVSGTQLRQVRRLVRDHNFRGFSAERTIEVWNSVRKGEFRWIYDNQEGVDFVFNSDLVYELCVLKKHALPLLNAINREDELFIDANNLIKILKLFKDIPDDLVPCNSLLREFIGDSCFYDL